LGLACVADITIALSGARFGLPETSLGIVPAQVAPFIRQKVGPSFSRLLAVAGKQFDTTWAHRLGSVQYLVAHEKQLTKNPHEILECRRSCGRKALATAKRLMRDSNSTEPSDPDRLGILFADALVSDEAAEGIAAFLERREPKWCQSTTADE